MTVCLRTLRLTAFSAHLANIWGGDSYSAFKHDD